VIHSLSRCIQGVMNRVVPAIGLLLVSSGLASVDEYASKFMREMHSSMDQMDRRMASASMNGNVDHDFASMMIPHHHGAIAMAKAEILYGKDPVIRRLAQEILVDQQSEIDAMQLWLKKAELKKGER